MTERVTLDGKKRGLADGAALFLQGKNRVADVALVFHKIAFNRGHVGVADGWG